MEVSDLRDSDRDPVRAEMDRLDLDRDPLRVPEVELPEPDPVQAPMNVPGAPEVVEYPNFRADWPSPAAAPPVSWCPSRPTDYFRFSISSTLRWADRCFWAVRQIDRRLNRVSALYILRQRNMPGIEQSF